MKIAVRLNQSARRFAAKAQRDGLGETVDIEKQTGTAGAASDTPKWTAIVEDWPCFFRPTKEIQGPRENVQGGNAPSFAYEVIGPAVTVSGSKVTAIVVKNTMRLRKKARGAETEKIYPIIHVESISGVQLKILAGLPE